jgi:hypothetical protein
MLTISLNKIINQIVRHHLIPQGSEKAMGFSFDIGLGYYEGGLSFSERRGIHLLYHLLPGRHSISVFSAITKSPFTFLKNIKEWKHECTHDSCWADINFFTNVYFDMAHSINMARSINDEIIKNGRKEVPPTTMSEHNNFRLFGDKLFDWVDVDVSKGPTDKHNYRRKVFVAGSIYSGKKAE